MGDRRFVLVSTVAGVVGVLAGMALGEMRPASAQRIDAAFSTGTFQVSAGPQNEAWRVNTSTGELYQCTGGQAVTCRRAELK